jgi:hypothetical protein
LARVWSQAVRFLLLRLVGKCFSIRENVLTFVRFQVLTAASLMFRAVFWVVHGSTTQKTALNFLHLICFIRRNFISRRILKIVL